jgi:hypothetical protein
MSKKYTNIFHCKTLKHLPKLGFLFENIPSGNPALEKHTTPVRRFQRTKHWPSLTHLGGTPSKPILQAESSAAAETLSL